MNSSSAELACAGSRAVLAPAASLVVCRLSASVDVPLLRLHVLASDNLSVLSEEVLVRDRHRRLGLAVRAACDLSGPQIRMVYTIDRSG